MCGPPFWMLWWSVQRKARALNLSRLSSRAMSGSSFLSDDPRDLGAPLRSPTSGPGASPLWRYRVGDWRIEEEGIEANPDLGIVSAYPAGAGSDLCRGHPGEEAHAALPLADITVPSEAVPDNGEG